MTEEQMREFKFRKKRTDSAIRDTFSQSGIINNKQSEIKNNNTMKVVGLTGGIGSGKTTVANFFKDLGIPVYIADDAARNLMNTSENIRKEITTLFGAESYIDKLPNRKFIASKVFNDKTQLDLLNNIIHPAVAADFEKWKLQQDAPYVIYEAAILFEKGGYKKCDYTILVTAPHDQKIKRIKARDQSSVEDIEARMNNQWDDERKAGLADFQIENLQLEQTRRDVENLHAVLLKVRKN
ncbi:dephospho-CoA kinase [Salegentibacter sp. F188]|uniref:Dephospho-CoA kinase n=1 Tax=Autumnicola patrickiae TaxID=3075591 RepID=A0ABU3DX38_9FLAO|nr:dephospho-CoA kinase [Salegentibacter sp. F188]MDT0688275.1 dephospho-CoA kinase [Salegentibacter sp. F188]